MKSLLIMMIFTGAGFIASAQSPLGIWKTIDDETGIAKSHVKIFETKDGKLQGQIIKILDPEKQNATCIECTGDKKDKPVKGMVILWGLSKDGDEWSGGQVLDPVNGKQYKCFIKLKGANQLELRGYIGFRRFGRTQMWQRVE